MTEAFAHSLTGQPEDTWEPLARHLAETALLAVRNAAPFGWDQVAGVAAQLHDIGKASAEFQAYIRGGAARGPDHSSAGAQVAAKAFRDPIGRILALLIAGHHSGLADPKTLDQRLARDLPAFDGWEAHAGTLPGLSGLRPSRPVPRPAAAGPAFSKAFLVRMLFSCLVDADFIATERFMHRQAVPARGGMAAIPALRDQLRAHMQQLRLCLISPRSALNTLRAEILEHAIGKAAQAPGFFTLTVPTGGGKTLASLAFALEHAAIHGRRRVVVVIPFTAIIEQTADVYRTALGDDSVLEHHSGFEWEDARHANREGGDTRDGLGALRGAAENWDAPIIVATAVQFFESLFANRTSRCRKLHNLADSVIVLDEAQTIPNDVLLPCMAALDELRASYGATVVLCTATQPALRQQDGALVRLRPNNTTVNLGFDICDARELAPRPRALYVELQRVRVEVLPGTQDDVVIAAAFAASPQMLCIVNSRAHARAIFQRINSMDGAVHLTTLMCAAHRRAVLADLRQRLKAGAPVRLVATSLIEAGVDISFPEVWRAMAGLDSIAQAAGRCNREGELLPALGRLVVFEPADAKPPAALMAFMQAARPILRDSPDPLGLDAVAEYFKQLYAQKGVEALDCTLVEGQPGILAAIRGGGRDLRFPFESIATTFRMIDSRLLPVFVPWGEGAALLDKLAHATGPLGGLLRQLQPYSVGIPQQVSMDWLSRKDIVPVRADTGEALLRLENTSLYSESTGLDLSDGMFRNVEANNW